MSSKEWHVKPIRVTGHITTTIIGPMEAMEAMEAMVDTEVVVGTTVVGVASADLQLKLELHPSMVALEDSEVAEAVPTLSPHLST